MELMSSFIQKVILSSKIKSNPDVPSYNIHTRPEEVPGVMAGLRAGACHWQRYQHAI